MEHNRPRTPRSNSPDIFDIKSGDIPGVRQLRCELGYGSAGQRNDIEFYNFICAYIFTFTSSNGLKGSKLTKWKSPRHQTALLELTNKFLEQDGKGVVYWPDNPTHANNRGLEYTRDRQLIKQTIAQLFLKINKEHKAKGSHKAMADPRYHARIGLRPQGTGQTVASPLPQRAFGFAHPVTVDVTQQRGGTCDPIDVDGLSFAPPTTSVESTTLPPEIPISAVPPQSTFQPLDQAAIEELVNPYDGPHSPPAQRRNGKRPITQSGRGQEIHWPNQRRCTTEPSARLANGTENVPVANNTRGLPASRSRQRRQTIHPGFYTGDACLDAIGSSEPSSDSEPGEPNTVETVDREAMYAYIGDGVSNDATEDRHPTPPPTVPESDLAHQSELLPEPEAEQVLQPPPGLDLEPEACRQPVVQHGPERITSKTQLYFQREYAGSQREMETLQFI
ncbi:hypothetical protein G7Z17_g12114 [Cylindrodendrum hubeiense]|uniref:Uncharacterized protein n=1 Tax=Cylindrodendrum hubeiense TaxID=595255 RepID=A0A9P5GW66_9HYPO|nr:hypothetical protein G7Z17_g12114 [Cylindrodendrum hubeiense]